MDKNTIEHKTIIEKTFISIDNNHKIMVKTENELASFEIIEFNTEKIITFLTLLKTICEYFSKNNIKNIVQTINRNDFKEFSRSKIISDIHGLENIVIMTPSNVFVLEITDALGIGAMKI